VTFLDAYALVALVADEPAAHEVEALLRQGNTALTTVNLAEAVDVVGRVHRVAEQDLREIVEPLLSDVIATVRPTETEAWRAADIRARYYDRRTCALSLADCFLIAATGPNDSIATADPPIAAVARAQGRGVVSLPDTAGHRP
jgi:uncharacterized protein with PIN domain